VKETVSGKQQCPEHHTDARASNQFSLAVTEGPMYKIVTINALMLFP
jgi:hypothetical protein